MEKGLQVLSDITIFQKYAKYISETHSRESWEDIVGRYEAMLREKYKYKLKNDKDLEAMFSKAIAMVREKKILPSMRALQFAGAAIERNESRIYNCCYMPVDSIYSFSEAMFLLLGGTGVGYSVQFHHVEQLPEIRKASKERKYLISDSIEGWADAVKALLKSYTVSNIKPRFDFSDIRPKGARLITAGGKAPGPEPLKVCLFHIETILERKKDGEKLTPLECHDIMCHIANAVLAGGIRRAAMISLFSFDDAEMLTCKAGEWYELNEQRGRANNSVVINRRRIKKYEFDALWDRIKLNRSGEPGLFFTNDKDWGTNPCAEIALRPYQFCNLCEINGSSIESKEDFIERAKAAAVLGTFQAGYTDFHYLRPIWKKTTERDSLLGVGITGIASNKITEDILFSGTQTIKLTNAFVAETLGINPANRMTCVKPSGTTSCVLGTSSGIHAWHSPFYIRTMRIGKNEPLYAYIKSSAPELVEDDVFRPESSAVLKFPIRAPEGSITRGDESAIDFLERVQTFNRNWIVPGHVTGENTHNISATITIKEEEWEEVKEWIWKHKDHANGLSLLPYDGGSYVQAPFQEIDEKAYSEAESSLHLLNLAEVIEHDDETNFTQEAACAGGICEIP